MHGGALSLPLPPANVPLGWTQHSANSQVLTSGEEAEHHFLAQASKCLCGFNKRCFK